MVTRKKRMTADFPVWYQPEAPLGSAVRYIASLSPKFEWSGIYLLKGKALKLGPYIGPGQERGRDATDTLVMPIRDRKDRIVGEIVIDSRRANAFGTEEEAMVRRVAQELGELWPE